MAERLMVEILGKAGILIERDGTLEICGDGYNESTRLLILHGDTAPDVPLPEAVASLLDLPADFDFQTPGYKSRALVSFHHASLQDGRLEGS